jgi:fatty-acid desaturase
MRNAILLKMFVFVPLLPGLVVWTLWGEEYWLLYVLAGVLLYYPVHQLGQAIGYHKLFAHRAFKPNKWYPYVATFVASIAFYGDPLSSAMIHRIHHRYSDKEGDPHSPVKGRFHAYLGWMWRYKPDPKEARSVVDLIRDFPWMVGYRRYEWLVPLVFHTTLYLLSPTISCVVLIACLLSIHNALAVNAFSHSPTAGALDIPFLARWANPAFMHKYHHDNGRLMDYSHKGVVDHWAWFTAKFLVSTK